MVPNPFTTLLAVRQPRPVSRRTPLPVMANCTEGSGPSLVFHARSGCPRVEARLLLLFAELVDTLDPVGEAFVVNVSRNPHCAQNRSLEETFSPQAGHEWLPLPLDRVSGTSLILPANRIVNRIMRFEPIPLTQAFQELFLLLSPFAMPCVTRALDTSALPRVSRECPHKWITIIQNASQSKDHNAAS